MRPTSLIKIPLATEEVTFSFTLETLLDLYNENEADIEKMSIHRIVELAAKEIQKTHPHISADQIRREAPPYVITRLARGFAAAYQDPDESDDDAPKKKDEISG